eukprot:365930-Chlamydomonas_euryale.AAC.4
MQPHAHLSSAAYRTPRVCVAMRTLIPFGLKLAGHSLASSRSMAIENSGPRARLREPGMPARPVGPGAFADLCCRGMNPLCKPCAALNCASAFASVHSGCLAAMSRRGMRGLLSVYLR